MNNVLTAAAEVTDTPGRLVSSEDAALTAEMGSWTCIYTGLTDVAGVDGGAGLSLPMRIRSTVNRTDAVNELVQARRSALAE